MSIKTETTIRKAEWNAQVVILVVCGFLFPVSWIYAALGEVLIGVWQLISAALNTSAMYNSPFKKRILIYWFLAVIALALVFFGDETMRIASMIGSVGIAVYYLIIYKQFMDYLTERKELSSLIR